jgi:MscS family membrane protein
MRRASALSIAVLFVTGAAVAQEPATDSIDRAPVPSAHASARATMRTFLEAFYVDGEPDLATAAACLDLSGLPAEVRQLKGRELASTLKQVLDRSRLVRFEEIPDDPEGPPYVFLRRGEGEVVIERTAGGEWLFNSSTVSSLDDLHRALEGREVVEGVERQGPEAVSLGTWLRGLMPPSLRSKVLFLEGWQWLGLIAIILAGIVAGRVFVFVATRIIHRVFDRGTRGVDPDIVIRTAGPLGALVTLLVWGLGIFWLGLPVAVFTLYYRAVRVVAIVVAVVVAYRLADLLAGLLENRADRTDTRFDDLLVPLVRKSLKVFVAAIGIVLIADTVGQDITALLAGLGLGGLALALAAQDTVSNLFGSLTVLIDRPFQVGDWVIVGDVEGTVEEVGFRSTRIRTFYNSLVTLPNSNLIKASVDNLGDRTYRRWKTTLAVTYDTPPERIDAFCEGVRELIRRHPYTRKDYFHVYLNDFGDASLNILLYTFFRTPDWATELRERHRLAVDILRLAADLGVEFAFPTQTVYLRNEEWQAPASAGEGYPGASRKQFDRARRRARELLQDTVLDSVPPPVSFDVPSTETRGDLDE